MTARTLRTTSAAYHAAELLARVGPMHRPALFARVDFGSTHNRNTTLDAAIDAGWLNETPEGVVVTAAGREKVGATEPTTKYVGQVAAIRTPLVSVWDVKPISKKHIPNRHGTRADVPAFSVRAEVRHFSVGMK